MLEGHQSEKEEVTINERYKLEQMENITFRTQRSGKKWTRCPKDYNDIILQKERTEIEKENVALNNIFYSFVTTWTEKEN